MSATFSREQVAASLGFSVGWDEGFYWLLSEGRALLLGINPRIKSGFTTAEDAAMDALRTLKEAILRAELDKIQ